MDIRRELLFGTVLVLGVLLLVAFGSIGLLGRMTPAIERILRENDYSIQATEDMLLVLARAETSTSALPAREARFDEALLRASSNVTEDEERPVLENIQAHRSRAIAGDPIARTLVVNELGRLAQINRDRMHATDHEAQRLGRAGAWAVVLVASLGFAAALVAFARVRRRILTPLQELYRTVRAFEDGNRARRAFCDPSAPQDLATIMRTVNRLLDAACSVRPGERPVEEEAIRVALITLMDESPNPMWLTDATGALLAANQAGLDALRGEEAAKTRERLTRPDAGSILISIGEHGHRLIRGTQISPEAGPSNGSALGVP